MKSIFKLILSIVTFLGVTYVLAIIFIVSILRSSSEKMSSNFNNVPYKIEKTVHDSYLPKVK